jgi:hypothetical protein
VPLRDDLQALGQRVVDHLDRGGDDAPFTIYQYDPSQEWQVRADLEELRRWLATPARGVTCAAVSLSRLFWTALDESGFADEVVAQETAAGGDPQSLHEVYDAVGEILRHQPTLPDRVLTEVDHYDDRTAVFLYQAGVLYPAYRTSTLLDDLRGRLRRPVTLLYPGRLVGDYGLSFMNRTEPSYGYRALITSRESQA